MKPFKQLIEEVFEDPFETGSNIERRERGEPDYREKSMFNTPPPSHNIRSLLSLFESMDTAQLWFRFVGCNVNLSTQTNVEKCLIEVKLKEPSYVPLVIRDFYIKALRKMIDRYSPIEPVLEIHELNHPSHQYKINSVDMERGIINLAEK